ncbi:MAG: signal recognition particle-docking protein FtsY [Pseudomonadota bacterium]
MILWFGKKKKKKELEEAGKAIEQQEAEQAAEAAEIVKTVEPVIELEPHDGDIQAPHEGLDPGAPHHEPADEAPLDLPGPEPDAEEIMDTPELAHLHDEAPTPLSDLPPADFTPMGPEESASAPETAQPEPPSVPAGDGSDVAADEASEDPVAETKKPGFFARMAKGLSRSSSRLSDSITGVFTKRKLDDDTLEELEDLLIAADLGAGVAARVTAGLAKDRFDKEVTDAEIKSALAEEITAVLAPREQVVDFADGPRPRIVLFVGVNGSGKTTTIGKIASKLRDQGAKALLVAGDTFRAAAIEQLTVWGERAGIPVLSKPTGADAAGLVYEAVEKAQREDLDLVLVDTAGRLQNKSELMAELAKIIRVTRKLDPDAPHDVILVLDATVGQNALSQVEAFRHTAGVTGLVMTKLDGTAKGGVLVAIADKHDLPIHFVGVGEKAEDLQPFSAEAFARALVGAT